METTRSLLKLWKIGTYSRFSHDVTKIQTKELSTLLIAYFDEALQKLTRLLIQISVRKSSSFSVGVRLNFQAFARRYILMAAEKALM